MSTQKENNFSVNEKRKLGRNIQISKDGIILINWLLKNYESRIREIERNINLSKSKRREKKKDELIYGGTSRIAVIDTPPRQHFSRSNCPDGFTAVG